MVTIHDLNHWKFTAVSMKLSHKSVKAYTTMPTGIMGSTSLALLDWGSRWFSNNERERGNTCVCAVCEKKNTITFRYCRVSFSLLVRQPFSKQLYLTLMFRFHWTVTQRNNKSKTIQWSKSRNYNRSLRSPELQIFIEMLCANLQSPEQSRHVGEPPWKQCKQLEITLDI